MTSSNIGIDTLLAEVQANRALPSPPMRRAIRQDAGVSLRRLAEAIDVSVQAVHHWEAGVRRPRPANAARYAAALRELQALGAKEDRPE